MNHDSMQWLTLTEIPNNLALRQDEKSRQDFETLLRQLEDAAEAVHSVSDAE